MDRMLPLRRPLMHSTWRAVRLPTATWAASRGPVSRLSNRIPGDVMAIGRVLDHDDTRPRYG